MGACTGVFPALNSALVNVETYIAHAHRLGALGAVHSNWGDSNDFRPYNWPGLAHFAEWAWEPNARTSQELLPMRAGEFLRGGQASLADVLLFLGDPGRYFGWYAFGVQSPASRPASAHAGEGDERRASGTARRLRRDLQKARATLAGRCAPTPDARNRISTTSISFSTSTR